MKRIREKIANFMKNNQETPVTSFVDNENDIHEEHVEYFTEEQNSSRRHRNKTDYYNSKYMGNMEIIHGELKSRNDISLACETRNISAVCGMNVIQVNTIDNASRVYAINIGTGDGSSFTLEKTGKILQYNIYRPLLVGTEAFHVSMLDSGSLSFGGNRGYVKNSGIIMKCDIFDAELLNSKLFDLRLRSTSSREPIVKIKFWNRLPNLTLKINGGTIPLPVSNVERFEGNVSCQSLVLKAPMVIFLRKFNYIPVTNQNDEGSDSGDNQ